MLAKYRRQFGAGRSTHNRVNGREYIEGCFITPGREFVFPVGKENSVPNEMGTFLCTAIKFNVLECQFYLASEF